MSRLKSDFGDSLEDEFEHGKPTYSKDLERHRRDWGDPNRDETVDIVKEVSNFILDEDLYDIYDMHSPTIPEIQYRKQSKDNENIDLKSLKPPSPSILPFDQQFLSDVWRPPSPSRDSFFGESTSTSTQPINFSENGLEKLLQQNIKIEKPKPIRMEDLEKDSSSKKEFLDKKSFAIASEVAAQEEITFKNLDDDQQKTNKPGENNLASSMNIAPPPGLSKMINNEMAMNFAALGMNIPPAMMHSAFTGMLQGVDMNMMPNVLDMLQLQKNMFELKAGRPLPVDMSFMGPNAQFCNPFFNQQQQDIISKIIVPAQAQRGNLQKGRDNDNNRKYENFMTQRDRDFLHRVFQLQTKRNDPYIDDYYEMNFKGKRLQERHRRKLAAEMNLPMDDPKIDAIIESQPLFVLPDRAERDVEKPRIIQFDGTLGKIQSANSRFPRKFFDIEEDTSAPLKLDSYQAALQRIESAYGILLEMIDEERRLPILPEDMKLVHRETQIKMCNELFEMLLNSDVQSSDKSRKFESNHFTLIGRNMPTLPRLQITIDPDIVNKSKGINLMIRFLRFVEDEHQLTVLLCALLRWQIYETHVLSNESCIIADAGILINKALNRISQTRNLIYIAASLDKFDFFTNNMYGPKMLVTLFKQYEGSSEKTIFLYFWKMFVNAVDEHVTPISIEMHELCVKHLEYLATI